MLDGRWCHCYRCFVDLFWAVFLAAMRVSFENYPDWTKLLGFFFLSSEWKRSPGFFYTREIDRQAQSRAKDFARQTWGRLRRSFLASLALAALASFTFFTELRWFIVLPLLS